MAKAKAKDAPPPQQHKRQHAGREQRPAKPVTRPLTRRTVQEFLVWTHQFSALPVELARLIVAVAARDGVSERAGWVARGLALVCRTFWSIVEPILISTVRMTPRNAGRFRFHLLRDRFACTKRVVFDGPPLLELDGAPRAQAVCGRPRHIAEYMRGVPLESVTMLTAAFMSDLDPVTWAAALSIRKAVVRVHVQEAAPEHLALLRTHLPRGLRLIIVDPIVAGPGAMNALLARLAAFVGDTSLEDDDIAPMPESVERVLVRTPYLTDAQRVTLVEALETLAAATRDQRLWLDDSIRHVRGKHGPVRQRIEDEEAGDGLWLTGRQLYSSNIRQD